MQWFSIQSVCGRALPNKDSNVELPIRDFFPSRDLFFGVDTRCTFERSRIFMNARGLRDKETSAWCPLFVVLGHERLRNGCRIVIPKTSHGCHNNSMWEVKVTHSHTREQFWNGVRHRSWLIVRVALSLFGICELASIVESRPPRLVKTINNRPVRFHRKNHINLAQ